MKKIKKILFMEIPKSELLNVWLSLFPMLLGVSIYSYLSVINPDYIKLDNGEFVNRLMAMLVLMPIPLVLNLLLIGTPRIDPLYKNYKKFAYTYNVFRRVIIIFFDLLIIGTIVMMAGVNISISIYSTVTIGCLFILIGGALKDVKQNYFFGMRTPWALLDEHNWNHTHQFSSKLFIVSGSIIALLGLINLELVTLTILVVLILILLSIIPFIVSYNYYTKHK